MLQSKSKKLKVSGQVEMPIIQIILVKSKPNTFYFYLFMQDKTVLTDKGWAIQDVINSIWQRQIYNFNTDSDRLFTGNVQIVQTNT